MATDISMGATNKSGEDASVWPVHIEVRMKSRSSVSFDSIRRLVHEYIYNNCAYLFMPDEVRGWQSSPILQQNVERIAISDSVYTSNSLPIEKCSLQIHVYQPTTDSTYDKSATNPSESSEEFSAGVISELPSRELEGLWESLYFNDDVKSRLLNYIYATVVFSDADVDYNLVSWNRVILLHGPPGTGKTSLCRALAQKLSIRLKERYSKTHLFEINSHSLFSRWFSESGKLVQSLFTTVTEMAREEEDFVVLLIDEVESLTAARAGVMSGTEPSDALRVVNALLTQIDRLKYQKNVLIMSTSNLAKAIDSAFVDRADITEYIDYPPATAVYEILRSTLTELMKKGIVVSSDVPPGDEAATFYKTLSLETGDGTSNSLQTLIASFDLATTMGEKDLRQRVGCCLFSLATQCKGMSGRALRRLPVLAHARYIGLMPSPPRHNQTNGIDDPSRKQKAAGTPTVASTSTKSQPIAVGVWLNAMQKVLDDETGNRKRFAS
ncbi:AAA-domain-containing protein [Schizopora paradoxa]|uniref:AAA-domain-containing protein n=1 Tax=Schizopora paradoxa TaxID=27342 RepID=A0A0H2RLG1_9AGAM|nr:AAA-domain-containing protein [Schizopora paradoxa]